MNHLEAYKKQVLFLTLAVNLFLVQRRQEGVRPLPLATGLPLEKRAFAVFFRASYVIPNAQLGADAIEVPKTDVDAELLLQCRLHLPTWHLWIGAAGRNQPLKHGFSQFRWMPMSLIEERSLSP